MMLSLPKTHVELTSALHALEISSADEIAKQVEEGGYLVSNKVALEELTLPELPEGWKLHSTTPHKLDLPRIIFIAATKPDTRLIWDRGQYAIARNAGLSNVAIQRWLKCNSKHKYRFLEHLSLAEKDESVKNAYMEYNGAFTDEQYREWVRLYSVRDSLSPSARVILVELIKEVIQ